MSRLTEPELDQLEQYLNAPERAESSLPLDMVQGLFAALACTPATQERWLPAILGEGQAADPAIAALLERFREETARQLDEADGFDFILYGEGEDEGLGAWADGFLAGVDIADPPWDEVAEADDLDNLLFPFLALSGRAKEIALEEGEEWMTEAEEARLLDEIREGFAQHLFDVRAYWFQQAIPDTYRRDEPKVGRNDPCHCGSGKKFKNCHGRDA